MTPTVYLLHGRDSNPQGLKIRHMTAIAKQCGWKVVAPDFTATKDPEERVRMFLEIAKENNNSKSIIVGSSMGGYVALVASGTLKPAALLLLAPAVNMAGYRETNLQPVADETTIIHGWNDELIEPLSVMKFAELHRTMLHMVDDDHVLKQSMPLLESVFTGILKRCCTVSRQSRLMAVI